MPASKVAGNHHCSTPYFIKRTFSSHLKEKRVHESGGFELKGMKVGRNTPKKPGTSIGKKVA